MKKIISLVVFILVITFTLYKPTIGKASGFQETPTEITFNDEVKNPSSNQTMYQRQMSFFLNMASMITTGQVNSVTNTASNLVAYQSIINIKEINRASKSLDGTNQPVQHVSDKPSSPLMEKLVEKTFKSRQALPNMTVKFLDVGQGDAIYIEYPNGKTALVDAGRYDTIIDSTLKAENITHIDTFIASHPDADHIGGAQNVIENYGVTKVIDGGQINDTLAYENYKEAINKTGVPFKIVQIGDNISDDVNVSAKVLFVNSHASETNNGSIVIMLSYGLTDILLTADAEIAVEEYLLNNYNLDAEILKVAHHGADTGTSRAFINAVSPTDAILQYGYNLFGLPHPKVVNDLISSGASIYSTFDRGTITVNTNGKQYSIKPNIPVHTGGSNETSNQLRITAKDLAGEVVTIKNMGTTPVNMTGWILLSVKGKQPFTFPNGFVLQAGGSVNITSGPNAVDNPPSSLKWTGTHIWNKDGDAAKLYDPFSKLIHKLK